MFSENKLKYLVELITSQGVSPDPEKVKAEYKTGVHISLGMVTSQIFQQDLRL